MYISFKIFFIIFKGQHKTFIALKFLSSVLHFNEYALFLFKIAKSKDI